MRCESKLQGRTQLAVETLFGVTQGRCERTLEVAG